VSTPASDLSDIKRGLNVPDAAKLQALSAMAMEIESKIDTLFPAWEPSNHSASNWASEIHHPCKRHLTYCRTHWQQRTPMDLDGRYRVDAGKDAEKKIKRLIEESGYEIELAQKRFEWPEFEITGKIDGMIRIGRARFPLEIKSMNPNFWDEHKTIEDIKGSRYWWIQKDTSQLNLYLLMSEIEGGFLALQTFGKRPRILPMLPDYDLADLDTAKAADVNRHVKAGTLPEPIPYSPSVCGMCGFDHICPMLKTLGSSWREISAGEQAEIDFYLELKEKKRLLKEMHRELVGDNKKPGRYFGANAIAGNAEITSGLRPMTRYSVPDDIKQQYKEKYEIISTSIERICK